MKGRIHAFPARNVDWLTPITPPNRISAAAGALRRHASSSKDAEQPQEGCWQLETHKPGSEIHMVTPAEDGPDNISMQPQLVTFRDWLSMLPQH